MSETDLKFGPEWLRALAHGKDEPPTKSEFARSVSPEIPLARYKLAQYRYGREEMLALYSKDLKLPDCLKEFDFLLSEKNLLPLALLPVPEEEQRIWARSINSDVALRVSGKTPSVPGNGSSLRGGRGGSVDRGRGRGRGGYYQRGISFEDNDDPHPGSFSRLRTMERSQSASEKDQLWEERDRRFERSFAGRTSSGTSSSSGLTKDGSRAPPENWRRTEDDDNNGWRTAGPKGGDKFGGRSSWRNHDRDRNRAEFDSKEKGQHVREVTLNGPGKSKSPNSIIRQRKTSGHFWDDETSGDNLPEWSVDEPVASTDVVGTFDSSGAFLETKVLNTTVNSDDVYISDEEEIVKKEEVSEKAAVPKSEVKEKQNINNVQSSMHQVQNTHTALNKKAENTSKLPSVDKTCIKKPRDLPNQEKCVPQVTNENVSVPVHVPKQVANKTNCDKLSEATVAGIPPPVPAALPVPATVSTMEEDAFDHHKKATEIMMAQWTKEEEQKGTTEAVDRSVVFPLHHENAQKWFYRDPQGEVQGPFTSAEMHDWFSAGYFSMNLLVRRGCDETFTQLGELIQSWGRMPFVPGTNPPPLRVTPVSTPLTTATTHPGVTSQTPSTPTPAQLTQTDAQLRLMQQQMLHQMVQQQLLIRQAQMQQLLNHLKQNDSFTSLNAQQQSVLVQQLAASQQQQQQQQTQVTRPGGISDTPVLDNMTTVQFPLLGLTGPQLPKTDLSMWNIPNPGAWPATQASSRPPSGSIWDADTPTVIEVSELEKKQLAEEEEKRKKAMEAGKRLEEERKRREEEQKRQEEELRRKEEEELRLKELQRQKEEEMQRLREDELRRQEEIRRLEERRKEEERRIEELRQQEEQRKHEQKQLEERRRKLEEQQRKLEEQQRKQAELEEKKKREAQQREELRLLEEERIKEEEEERRRQEELEKAAKEQERLREIEKQKEAQRLKQEQLEREAQKESEIIANIQLQKELESNQRLHERKGPVWGIQNQEKSSEELSLSAIQKLQAKEREERERIKHLQQQQLLLQQQSLKEAQATKNGLNWVKRLSGDCEGVKSLAEIQEEEAKRVAQQQKVQKTAATAVAAKVQVAAAAISVGVWGNSSQTNRLSSAPGWNSGSNCFWDSAVKSTTAHAQNASKTNDSAFPALTITNKPSSVISNKSRSIRAKKDEDAVLKLFEAHRKPTDEFTMWCTQALANLPSSVDVPTFVAFLKDIESPYEVHDYIRSYLGEGKEAQEFGKQFLERRSKYRNQAKKSPSEENMWGPAPAITPTVNKTAVQSSVDCDGTTCTKGKTKKKKNKMQRLDSSMLGFTVQPNPDRVNAGEIDRVDGM